MDHLVHLLMLLVLLLILRLLLLLLLRVLLLPTQHRRRRLRPRVPFLCVLLGFHNLAKWVRGGWRLVVGGYRGWWAVGGRLLWVSYGWRSVPTCNFCSKESSRTRPAFLAASARACVFNVTNSWYTLSSNSFWVRVAKYVVASAAPPVCGVRSGSQCIEIRLVVEVE